ncbi:unnamed protein product [Allacma fusca]|uniref:Uncharacterized protein n=1 Tax=Allacma fusca TaxID=39272 RepID=A0A8J2K362_9HEXA|nr:unnamed protein product [Allacma fusca]
MERGGSSHMHPKSGVTKNSRVLRLLSTPPIFCESIYLYTESYISSGLSELREMPSGRGVVCATDEVNISGLSHREGGLMIPRRNKTPFMVAHRASPYAFITRIVPSHMSISFGLLPFRSVEESVHNRLLGNLFAFRVKKENGFNLP